MRPPLIPNPAKGSKSLKCPFCELTVPNRAYRAHFEKCFQDSLSIKNRRYLEERREKSIEDLLSEFESKFGADWAGGGAFIGGVLNRLDEGGHFRDGSSVMDLPETGVWGPMSQAAQGIVCVRRLDGRWLIISIEASPEHKIGIHLARDGSLSFKDIVLALYDPHTHTEFFTSGFRWIPDPDRPFMFDGMLLYEHKSARFDPTAVVDAVESVKRLAPLPYRVQHCEKCGFWVMYNPDYIEVENYDPARSIEDGGVVFSHDPYDTQSWKEGGRLGADVDWESFVDDMSQTIRIWNICPMNGCEGGPEGLQLDEQAPFLEIPDPLLRRGRAVAVPPDPLQSSTVAMENPGAYECIYCKRAYSRRRYVAHYEKCWMGHLGEDQRKYINRLRTFPSEYTLKESLERFSQNEDQDPATDKEFKDAALFYKKVFEDLDDDTEAYAWTHDPGYPISLYIPRDGKWYKIDGDGFDITLVENPELSFKGLLMMEDDEYTHGLMGEPDREVLYEMMPAGRPSWSADPVNSDEYLEEVYNREVMRARAALGIGSAPPADASAVPSLDPLQSSTVAMENPGAQDRWAVLVWTYGNIDLGEDPEESCGSVRIKAPTRKELVKKVREWQDENDIYAGHWGEASVFEDGKKIGRMSYNGRIWEERNGKEIEVTRNPGRRRRWHRARDQRTAWQIQEGFGDFDNISRCFDVSIVGHAATEQSARRMAVRAYSRGLKDILDGPNAGLAQSYWVRVLDPSSSPTGTVFTGQDPLSPQDVTMENPGRGASFHVLFRVSEGYGEAIDELGEIAVRHGGTLLVAQRRPSGTRGNIVFSFDESESMYDFVMELADTDVGGENIKIEHVLVVGEGDRLPIGELSHSLFTTPKERVDFKKLDVDARRLADTMRKTVEEALASHRLPDEAEDALRGMFGMGGAGGAKIVCPQCEAQMYPPYEACSGCGWDGTPPKPNPYSTAVVAVCDSCGRRTAIDKNALWQSDWIAFEEESGVTRCYCPECRTVGEAKFKAHIHRQKRKSNPVYNEGLDESMRKVKCPACNGVGEGLWGDNRDDDPTWGGPACKFCDGEGEVYPHEASEIESVITGPQPDETTYMSDERI